MLDLSPFLFFRVQLALAESEDKIAQLQRRLRVQEEHLDEKKNELAAIRSQAREELDFVKRETASKISRVKRGAKQLVKAEKANFKEKVSTLLGMVICR